MGQAITFDRCAFLSSRKSPTLLGPRRWMRYESVATSKQAPTRSHSCAQNKARLTCLSRHRPVGKRITHGGESLKRACPQPTATATATFGLVRRVDKDSRWPRPLTRYACLYQASRLPTSPAARQRELR